VRVVKSKIYYSNGCKDLNDLPKRNLPCTVQFKKLPPPLHEVAVRTHDLGGTLGYLRISTHSPSLVSRLAAASRATASELLNFLALVSLSSKPRALARTIAGGWRIAGCESWPTRAPVESGSTTSENTFACQRRTWRRRWVSAHDSRPLP